MRRNAFGQLIYNPRLRFVDPPENNPGGGGGDPAGGGGGGDLGFPEKTPLTEMTVEQREAYWRHHARKHEKIADARGDYDQLKADSEELSRLRAENATEQDKALEEARREGETIGAERYLKDAVTARFQALTGKTDDEVATVFAHVDARSFTNTGGDIDIEKLNSFAATVGTTAPKQNDPPRDPVKEALERQRGGGGSSSGSIAEMTAARVAALKGNK